MLLLIGWRGAPDIADEIQHKVQGAITQDLLKLMEQNPKFYFGSDN